MMEDPEVMTVAPPVNKFSAFVETQSSSAFFERFVIIIEFRTWQPSNHGSMPGRVKRLLL